MHEFEIKYSLIVTSYVNSYMNLCNICMKIQIKTSFKPYTLEPRN